MPEQVKENQTNETKKFTEDELKQVREIQNSYYSIQQQLGQVSLAKHRLDENKEELLKSLKNVQDKEQSFLDGIRETYGEGTLNPDTGEFTPNK
tara:strand:- start:312 stop:593 length:282 start_codon:yes stop_codon:yes gene_type:complete